MGQRGRENERARRCAHKDEVVEVFVLIEAFIEEYAKKIATDIDKIRAVRREIEENFSEITIFASSQDAGRLIGRNGHMIGALKTLVSGCKAKDGCSYKIIVKTVE